jgi:cytochrome c
MKYLIATFSALLLLGCESAEQKSPEKTVATPAQSVEIKAAEEPASEEKAPAQEANMSTEATEPEEAEPTGLQKTVAPALPAQKKASSGSNGKLLFVQKCASCHGQKAEKMALGKSQVIAGWEASAVEAALIGYREGTYGGPMKGLMAGQVKVLDEAQIKALSDYISTL